MTTTLTFTFPCKVGDTVFCIYQDIHTDKPELVAAVVDHFEVYKDYVIISVDIGGYEYRYFLHEMGKVIFLDKKEAEEAFGVMK